MAPPFAGTWLQSLAAAPSLLGPRARALALLAHLDLLGRVEALLRSADEAAVARALGKALQPGAVHWHAILPTPVPAR
jgi:hypothetical protein